MRKIVFIVLAVVVAALVAFFCWREFLVPSIDYVDDYTKEEDNHFKIQRLYAAHVDEDAYNEALDSILNTTDYDEDSRLSAAVAAGQPEFLPTFNVGVNLDGDDIRLDGFVSSERAANQKEERFRIDKISVEMVVLEGDLKIDRVDITRPTEDETGSNNSGPLALIYSEHQGAVDITDASAFSVSLKGNSGTVSLQFVYSIGADTFVSRTVLDEQFLLVQTKIERNGFGTLSTAFNIGPYSKLDDLDEQEEQAAEAAPADTGAATQ